MAVIEAAIETMDAVRAFVQAAIDNAGEEYHSGQLAVTIFEQLRDEQPELFERFESLVALDQLKVLVSSFRYANRRRTSTLSRHGYSITEAAPGNVQRRIGDMVKSDLDYAARAREKQGRRQLLITKRLRALRDRMPDETSRVRDVIPEEEVEAVYAP